MTRPNVESSEGRWSTEETAGYRREVVEQWRRLNPRVQDAAAGIVLLLGWIAVFAYFDHHGWNPRRPGPYLLAGVWSAAALALRRIEPVPVFVVTATMYPLVFDPPLMTEFQLLPLLIAAYAAASAARRWLPAVLVATMASAFVLAVIPGYDLIGRVLVPWDRVLVVEFATVCVVLLGAMAHDQRRTSEELARRNAELERLREIEAAQAIADERTRIARELHDVVAHHLTAVIVRAQAADRVAATDPDAGPETLRWVVTTAREALTSVRQTVQVLRSDDETALRTPGPSLRDIDGIAERVRSAGLDVSVDLAPLPELDPQVESAVVRIVQESLTNVLRHADARRARVSLHATVDRLSLEVDDDGAAVAPAGDIRGHGLIGMRERATSSGGEFDLDRGELGGWRVRASWPAAVHWSATA